MLEKMKAVSNPLTIIALFAALAEVAGTISLKFLDPSLQKIFIWFVMGFPTLIVVLFFIVLLKKREALYGPGDFKEDKSFNELLNNARQALELETIQKMLTEFKDEVKNDLKKVEAIGTTERNQLIAIINDKIQPVQNVVEVAKSGLETLNEAIARDGYYEIPDHPLNAVILAVALNSEPLTMREIAEKSGTSQKQVRRFLIDSIRRGLIRELKDGDTARYQPIIDSPLVVGQKSK